MKNGTTVFTVVPFFAKTFTKNIYGKYGKQPYLRQTAVNTAVCRIYGWGNTIVNQSKLISTQTVIMSIGILQTLFRINANFAILLKLLIGHNSTQSAGERRGFECKTMPTIIGGTTLKFKISYKFGHSPLYFEKRFHNLVFVINLPLKSPRKNYRPQP